MMMIKDKFHPATTGRPQNKTLNKAFSSLSQKVNAECKYHNMIFIMQPSSSSSFYISPHLSTSPHSLSLSLWWSKHGLIYAIISYFSPQIGISYDIHICLLSLLLLLHLQWRNILKTTTFPSGYLLSWHLTLLNKHLLHQTNQHLLLQAIRGCSCSWPFSCYHY